MSVLERRTYTPLGKPRAGAMVRGADGVARVPIDFSNGDIFWLDSSQFGRDFITALFAGVNQLEALSSGSPDPEQRTDDTAVIDAVPDEPPLPVAEGDALVHPTTKQEVTNA